MDHYAFMLDRLQEDGFHRLRAFAGDGRGQFTTWLVVVARRLCVEAGPSGWSPSPRAS